MTIRCLGLVILRVVFIINLSPDRTKWGLSMLLIRINRLHNAQDILLTTARDDIDENVAKFNTRVA